MIKKILNFISSMTITIILMALFALSSAIGTFIENDFDRESAYVLIYETWWFEAIMVFFSISILANIFKYKLFKSGKRFILFFHISFIVILIGSFLTRYFGYESTLHIREGRSENKMVSERAYIHIKIKDKSKVVAQKSFNTSISKSGKNSFNYTLPLNSGDDLSVSYKGFMRKAKKIIEEGANGQPMIDMKISTTNWVKDIQFQKNRPLNFGNMIFTLDYDMKTFKDWVKFYNRGEKFYFISNVDINYLRMEDQQKGVFAKEVEHELILRHLYTIDNINFVPRDVFENGVVKVIKDGSESLEVLKNDTTSISALITEVRYKDEVKEVSLLGRGRSSKGSTEFINIGGLDVELEWGAKVIPLPFKIELQDFILDRYPGSQSPSSYESRIRVIDEDNNVSFPYRVYMNSVLDYEGFRFFQASYDKDEKGTILSVNKDPGKIPTYMGYFMLIVGLILALIHPKSRFRRLMK